MVFNQRSNILATLALISKAVVSATQLSATQSARLLLLSSSAPKITERERKLALIFALKKGVIFANFKKKIPSKTQESKLISRCQTYFFLKSGKYCP